MALLENILLHGSIYTVLTLLYLLVVMKSLSPRIWAYSDYPPSITDSVPPQTPHEKKIAGITVIPFLLLTVGFPIWSTLTLEGTYPGPMPLLDAFLNLYGLLLMANISEVLLLDLLIVGTITPDWVIIPGTEGMRNKEYKEFRYHHGKAHLRAIVVMAFLAVIIALGIVFF